MTVPANTPNTFSNSPADTNIIDADLVNENFDELYDGFPVDDADMVSPNNSAYRTLLTTNALFTADRPATTSPLANTIGGTEASASDSTVFSQNAGSLLTPSLADDWRVPLDGWTVPIYAADYAVAGKTAKLRIRTHIFCNATAPAINFTVGLYPLTVAGGADALVITLGTVVTGSTAVLTTPSASTITPAVGSDISLPTDGVYGLAVVTSGTLANNASAMLAAQLQIRNV